MTQSRYGVLLSTILLGLLTAAFFFAARAAVNQLKSTVAKANPTATATPLILVAAAPSATGGNAPVRPTATHVQSAVPPTDTPSPQSANVIVNSSETDAVHTMTSLPSSTYQVWCHVIVPGVTTGTPIKFRFQRVGTPGDYWVQPESVVSSGNESYILGPLQTGQWRCLVEVEPSGKLVGSTSFAITP
jgi:hypothetical protein